MISNKKALGPVVAVSLLVVVSVVSVLAFGSWHQSYSSKTFADVSEKSEDNGLSIEGIYDDVLYLRSEKNMNIIILSIINISGNVLCKIDNNKTNNKLGIDTRMLLNFDDDNVTDLSLYKNNFTLMSGVNCSVEGISGKGCYFSGNYSKVKFYPVNISNTQGSITLWLKPANSDVSYTFFSNYLNDYNRTRLSVAENKFRLYSGYLGTPSQIMYFEVNMENITKNTWYHITYVYNYNKDTFDFYVNGDLKHREISNISIHTVGEITLGAQKDWDLDTDYGYFFNGTMDEVAIYSKPLNEAEVKVLYNSQKSKFYEQLIPDGVKEIDLSNCNLQEDSKYKVIAFTEDGTKTEAEVIVG